MNKYKICLSWPSVEFNSNQGTSNNALRERGSLRSDGETRRFVRGGETPGGVGSRVGRWVGAAHPGGPGSAGPCRPGTRSGGARHRRGGGGVILSIADAYPECIVLWLLVNYIINKSINCFHPDFTETSWVKLVLPVTKYQLSYSNSTSAFLML